MLSYSAKFVSSTSNQVSVQTANKSLAVFSATVCNFSVKFYMFMRRSCLRLTVMLCPRNRPVNSRITDHYTLGWSVFMGESIHHRHHGETFQQPTSIYFQIISPLRHSVVVIVVMDSWGVLGALPWQLTHPVAENDDLWTMKPM